VTLATGLLWLTLALYLAGAVVLAANLFLRRPVVRTLGRAVAVVSALAHTAFIGAQCVATRHAPFATPAEALSALAWMVALTYLLAAWLWKLDAAGPFALALAFLLLVVAGAAPAYQGTPNPRLMLSSPSITVHITATLAALGAFSLAFCCAALYLIEHHILKSKQGLVWLKRLPPLVTVESAAFWLVAFGFPLLTLGILSGLLITNGALPRDPHSLTAFGVWAVYGAYLIARLRADWPPVRTAYVLLVGLALCLMLFFVPAATHRFG
jgi:ABC-type uncharacterized transport system permease subunit